MTTAQKSLSDQNDAFRPEPRGPHGKAVMTRGIAQMDQADHLYILNQVGSFDAFNKDNDPDREHDFGSFEYRDQTIFWKIDYFDTKYEYGSEDPANPEITRRVLTVMLSSEY